jgi:LysM repeat protein
METRIFLLVILYFLFQSSVMPAAAETQTWKVRPGDNLETIATTLDISKEEIKRQNPGVLESNLQVGRKLKLPLRSYAETKGLEEELGKKDARIGELESKGSDLAKKITSAESQLRWQPIWFWGFWICFGIIAFIACGVYWIFRQTHPRVFEQPHDRSIRDLKESQTRLRSSFYDEERASSRDRQWHPPLRRLPSHR